MDADVIVLGTSFAGLGAFTRHFGDDAGQPLRYLDHVWQHEPWSRGCYAAVARPGIQSTVGHTAREPHGHVFWAGTETATRYNGYLEGAVRSGFRAADEVGSLSSDANKITRRSI